MAQASAVIEEKSIHALEVLSRHIKVEAAYLFGSQVEGRADQWSDIDVGFFIEGVEDWDIEKHANYYALVVLEAGSDIEPHFFSARKLEEMQPSDFSTYVVRHGVEIRLKN